MSVKWMFAIIVNLVAIDVGSAIAQPPGGGSGRGPQCGPPWARARIMFQLFDADGDGALTADEAPEHAWIYLSAADADEDRKVTQKEVALFAAAQMIGIFDQNEDGELSADEAPEPLWARVSEADADESGSVSATEIAKTIVSKARRGGPPAEVTKK